MIRFEFVNGHIKYGRNEADAERIEESAHFARSAPTGSVAPSDDTRADFGWVE